MIGDTKDQRNLILNSHILTLRPSTLCLSPITVRTSANFAGVKFDDGVLILGRVLSKRTVRRDLNWADCSIKEQAAQIPIAEAVVRQQSSRCKVTTLFLNDAWKGNLRP